MKLIIAALFAIILTVPAWAQDKEPAPKQDGEKKAPPKDGGDPVKKPAAQDDGGKVVKKGAAEEPTLGVDEVDTNGDGRISASELKAALGRMYPKKDGGGAKEGGDVKKPVNKDGAPVEKKAPANDGGAKDFPKQTEGEKNAEDKKKDGSKEGGDVKKPASKDGQK